MVCCQPACLLAHAHSVQDINLISAHRRTWQKLGKEKLTMALLVHGLDLIHKKKEENKSMEQKSPNNLWLWGDWEKPTFCQRCMACFYLLLVGIEFVTFVRQTLIPCSHSTYDLGIYYFVYYYNACKERRGPESCPKITLWPNRHSLRRTFF